MPPKDIYKVIAQNKKARHNYLLLETLEVGIALLGNEVKSIRQGRVNLRDAYARVINNELWLFNCHITPYPHAHRAAIPDPVRDRKLLLHRRQLNKWLGKVQEKSLTLVPVKLYFKKSHVKLEIALAQAKKLHDKCASLKEKSVKRDIQKDMKY